VDLKLKLFPQILFLADIGESIAGLSISTALFWLPVFQNMNVEASLLVVKNKIVGCVV
jgi:hypothetical protein